MLGPSPKVNPSPHAKLIKSIQLFIQLFANIGLGIGNLFFLLCVKNFVEEVHTLNNSFIGSLILRLDALKTLKNLLHKI